jgi:ATP-dependent DNA helicase RecG
MQNARGNERCAGRIEQALDEQEGVRAVNNSLDHLAEWMRAEEDEHLEFKEAKNHFDFEVLVKYCCALANEGGGHIILGVTDKRPRRVVGAQAFKELQRTKTGLIDRLRLRIEAEELSHADGRVLVFTVPARPVGVPLEYKGAYWMRGGESLIPMTPDLLKRIFEETQPDFSAQVCAGASMSDLDPAAIKEFQRRWAQKTRRDELLSLSDERLLEAAELVDDGVTYAALALLGSRAGLGRHLAQAEVVFEYRSDEGSIEYQAREEFRVGLFLFFDRLWELINVRNQRHSYQEGLFRYDFPAFNEEAVREALLNAISHRDYRLSGSIFVKQFPAKLEVTSPGGFPPGITAENIIFKQAPRNRRIAEALGRCGLVERSGQGADRMFATAIREGKLPPAFEGTDAYQVVVTLHGKVQDQSFLVFLERLANERQATFRVEDLLVLDAVHRQIPIPPGMNQRLAPLRDMGALERIGRGKGVRYLLSRQFYKAVGLKGVYTRKRGLDRETNKALLMRHIRENASSGSQLAELSQVLPALSRDQVQKLLQELKREGHVHSSGVTRAGRWFPGSQPDGDGA